MESHWTAHDEDFIIISEEVDGQPADELDHGDYQHEFHPTEYHHYINHPAFGDDGFYFAGMWYPYGEADWQPAEHHTPAPRRHHDPYRYRCVFHSAGCPFSSRLESDLRHHVTTVHFNNQFEPAHVVPDTQLPRPATHTPAPRRHHDPYQYRCVFHIAGCPFSCLRRSDWFRHVSFVHFNNQSYYLCTEGACARGSGTDNIFRRTDYYLEHLRLRHRIPPPRLARAEGRALANAAFHRRYTLPEAMGCPAAGCADEFNGVRAWQERMEHVAGHLHAAAAAGAEDPVGPVDWEVLEWASGDDVGIVEHTQEGGWVLRPQLF